MTTALLILDAQVNMFDESPVLGREAMPVYDGQTLLERLAVLISRARSTAIPLIYEQNAGGPGDPDELGTPGFEIHPALAPHPGEPDWSMVEYRCW